MDPVHLALIEEMRSCDRCPLAGGRTQVVVGDYGPEGGVCFIGEAPGQREDEQGRPFVGRSGKLLDQMLSGVGLPREGVSVLNICKCRPPDNRTPTPDERRVCSGLWLERQLEYLRPSLVVTLGSTALNHFQKGARITKVMGQVLEGTYRVFPMVHPSYVLRGSRSRDDYLEDFRKMLAVHSGEDSPAKKSQQSLDDFF